MIDLTKPRPCVFCSGTDLEIRAVVFRHWNIHCTQCEAKGPTGKTPDEAIRKWNAHDNPSIQIRQNLTMPDTEQSKTEKIWKACRAMRTFTVSEIKRITEIDSRETVRKYIYLLEKQDYLRIEAQKNAPGAPNVYRVIRPKVIEAPDWSQLRYPDIDEAMTKEDVRNMNKVKVKATG